MIELIVTFLKAQLGTKPAVLGLSGGIDSAVVAALLVQAIPFNHVYGLYLPSETNTPADLVDASQLAAQLGIQFEIVPIDPLLQAYQTVSPALSLRALGNLKARVRMALLYTRANTVDGLVVGTGNKTELQLGYFTKYGDGGVDLLPIAHLYKTQILELAKQLHIPDRIITKPPTAGLWAGQTDEAELGVTYLLADQILLAIEQNHSLQSFDPVAVARVRDLMQAGQHKQQTPPHL